MHTLLLADESITVQRVIALTFAEQEIRVVSVPDGHQAMERMTAQKPDIVLAGTTLPQVSGYELTQMMRSKPALKDVPVLLLAGAFEIIDEARLMASGANGVLEKPVEPTVVIGRVKELLGLKSEEKPDSVRGRMITPASVSSDAAKKLPTPTPPRAVTSTRGTSSNPEQLRSQTGLDAKTKSVEDAAGGRGDYLDTLDTAFDTLDQHLAGRPPATKTPRNPAGPLGQASPIGDPRSPSPRAAMPAVPDSPVYEVDDDWFGEQEGKERLDVRAGRREITEDLRDPSLSPSPAKPEMAPVYEVDDEWFKDDDKARAAKAVEHKLLAAEMGIHEVGFGNHEKKKPTDLDLGIDDLKTIAQPAAPKAVDPPAPPKPASIAPMPPLSPPEIKVVTPEITGAMLDQIATRVADRLTASAFGAELREAMTATMRDAVNQTVAAAVGPVVSETAERVVREVVPRSVETVVREIVPQAAHSAVREVVGPIAERVVGEIVSATAERAVRDAVSHTTERVVREIVPATAERIIRDVVVQATEHAMPEAVSQATERAVRDVVPATTERVVRDVISATSERLVREEIERIKSRREV